MPWTTSPARPRSTCCRRSAPSWLFLVAAELIAAAAGLGFLLIDSQNNGRVDNMVLAIILLAIFGKMTDSILGVFEKRAIRRWT